MKLFSKLFGKKENKADHPFCSVIVAAAGSSRRMEGQNKLMLPLDGIPVLARTLLALDGSRLIDEIVVAVREEDLLPTGDLCRLYGVTKPVKIVRGGESRLDSVLAAAMECREDAAFLAVHDGARPLADPELIDRVVYAAARSAAAAPAVAVKDTVKAVREDGGVGETLNRERLRAVQTPQVFEASLLKAALQSALEQEASVTDDASAVERLGKVVFLVEGEEENLKITTPMDLILAEAIVKAREEGR